MLRKDRKGVGFYFPTDVMGLTLMVLLSHSPISYETTPPEC